MDRVKNGRGDWIRTSDPLRPRQVRYQAALRPDRDENLDYPPFLSQFPTANEMRSRNLSSDCRRVAILTGFSPKEVLMSEQQKLEIVRQGYDAFGRGDINALLALVDENVEWITPGPSEIPTAGTRRGRQAVGEFFKTLNETFEIARFEAREFVAQGDRVVVFGDDTARLKATGKVPGLRLGSLLRREGRQDRQLPRVR
jgi:uncharacterized protein